MKSSLNQRRLAASAAGGGWFLAVARQGMQVKPVDSTSFKMVLIGATPGNFEDSEYAQNYLARAGGCPPFPNLQGAYQPRIPGLAQTSAR